MYNNKGICITLLANAGILLHFNDTSILIDGIHVNEGAPFSGLSDQMLSDLIDGKNIFKNIDFILFTHCHTDHFNANYTERFLMNNHVKGLIMPNRQTQKYSSLRQTGLMQADHMVLLDIPLTLKKYFQLTYDISLTVFNSVHAGEQYADIENFCYLINFCGVQLFIIGDADFRSEYFEKMLHDAKIDIAFVNPLFINNKRGREVINNAIKPKHLVIYHIPFKNDDKIKFRKLVSNDILKHNDDLPPVTVLWNELQEKVF